jgi:hypothetical protein
VHKNYRRTNKQGWAKVRHYHLNRSMRWAKTTSARMYRRRVSFLMAHDRYDDILGKPNRRTLWGVW